VRADVELSEVELLARLRAGDERAFAQLVSRHTRAMTRLALSFVQTPAIADEVVQETWLAVIRGLDRFEGRASLKTWIFRILVNRARSRGVREQRTMPFSSFGGGEEDEGPTVDPDKFVPGGEPFAGYWVVHPTRFFELPEEVLLAAETRELLHHALGELPERQQQVVRLRDVEGWDAEEVCETLSISPANQRVLLHRGRAALRAALESHLSDLVQT
jgi:RNA polymerase sigma-70 factor (ECF subfamily)